MALNLDDKKQIVTELAAIAASAHSAVGAEYRGLSVAQMTELRKQAREQDVYLRVVKNNLAKRALAGTDFECMQPELHGPLVLAFSLEEPSSAARLVRDFARTNDQLKARMVSFGGELMGANDLERLASLPTREEALSQLMATMRAPLDKFARTVNEVPGKLVRTVAAIRDQKQAA